MMLVFNCDILNHSFVRELEPITRNMVVGNMVAIIGKTINVRARGPMSATCWQRIDSPRSGLKWNWI